MQILKILGVILILTAGGLAAATAVRFEQKKIRILESWIDLIFHIRTQIDCYLMPLGEILEQADRALIASCMCVLPNPNLTQIYHASQFYLGNEARRLLCAFVREIGTSYREEQVRRCDYYMSALRGLRSKARDELPARIRVTVAVCVAVSVGAAILLW